MVTQNTDDNTEHRELDLTNREDLDVFLQSAEDVCADALEFEPIAKAEGYERLNTEGAQGEKTFATLNQKLTALKKLIGTCRNEILPSDGEIEDSQVESMQELYDDMIQLRNHLYDTYEDYIEPIETEETSESVMLSVIDSNKTISPEDEESEEFNISEGQSEVVKVEEESLEVETKKPESVPAPAEQVPENSAENEEVSAEKNTENENLFTSTEEKLEQVKKQVTGIHERMYSLFSVADTTAEVGIDLAELDVCVTRIRDLEKRIEDSKKTKEDDAVLKSNLSRYERVAREIVVNAKAIEQVLLQKNSSSTEDEREEVLKHNDTVSEVEILEPAPKEQTEINQEDEQEGDQEDSEEEIEELTPEVKRKDMQIVSDDEMDSNITIRVAKKTEERLGIETRRPKIVVTKNVSQIETEPNPRPIVVAEDNSINKAPVVAELESQDPINEVVPDKVPVINHAELVHEETSLQRKYLNNDRHASFIKHEYSSPAAFERMLDTEVTKREAETIDGLERFFGETYASPFAFMQELTMSEVQQLISKPNVRSYVKENGMKYETFLSWIDLIDEMQSMVGVDQKMTFGELFARWIIENQIAYHAEKLEASQFTG